MKLMRKRLQIKLAAQRAQAHGVQMSQWTFHRRHPRRCAHDLQPREVRAQLPAHADFAALLGFYPVLSGEGLAAGGRPQPPRGEE
jgi:hypothetical protein